MIVNWFERMTCKNGRENAFNLIFALILAIIFTIGLIFATFGIPTIVNEFLRKYIPDFGLIPLESDIYYKFKLYGYISLSILLLLIIAGIILGKTRLLTTSSIVVNLSFFGYFAFAMFVFAGIGVLRVIWYPLVSLSPQLMRLGDATLTPILLPIIIMKCFINHINYHWLIHFSQSMWFLASIGLMAIGGFIMFLGIFTFLYGKFIKCEIIDFWIYKFIRHPQYLGFIIYSYGFLLTVIWIPYPRGGYYPPPTLPWLISFLLIIASALIEEINLKKQFGEKYIKYMEKTSFMMPLPCILKELISLPLKLIFGKNYPERKIEVLVIVAIYFILMILASIPIVYTIKFY